MKVTRDVCKTAEVLYHGVRIIGIGTLLGLAVLALWGCEVSVHGESGAPQAVTAGESPKWTRVASGGLMPDVYSGCDHGHRLYWNSHGLVVVPNDPSCAK